MRAALATTLACGAAATCASAAPVPLAGRALALGATARDATAVTHRNRLYMAVIEEQHERRALFVRRLVGDHLEPVGGQLNTSVANWARSPQLLSIGDVLYAAWIEARHPYGGPGQLVLARLQEAPDGNHAVWMRAAPPGPAPVAYGTSLRMAVVAGRPALAYYQGFREPAIGVATAAGWRIQPFSELAMESTDGLSAFADTLATAERDTTVASAFYDPVTGENVPPRLLSSWRLERAAWGENGRFHRLRPIPLPEAANAQLLTLDRRGPRPTLAWLQSGQIVVAQLDPEAGRTTILATIPVRRAVHRLAVTRVGADVAVAAITDHAVRVYRVRLGEREPVIDTDQTTTSPAPTNAIDVITGPNGEPVVTYLTAAGEPAVVAFTFER